MAWLRVVPVLLWVGFVQGWVGEEDFRDILSRRTPPINPQALSRSKEQGFNVARRAQRREDKDLNDDSYDTKARWPQEGSSTWPVFPTRSPRQWSDRTGEIQSNHFPPETLMKNSATTTSLHWIQDVDGHNPLGKKDHVDSGVAASHHWSHGGGEDHHSDHHNKHGHKAHKGYESKHHHDHGKKGHHDKEGSSGHHEENGGHKKKHHDEGGYHKEHHKGEKGHKGHKYHDKGSYKKGHCTKGKHVVHKLDEYKKNKHFHDEDYDEGHHKKHGGYHHHHDHHHGGKYKKGHKKSGYHEDHKGKKGHHKKGDHYHEHKGHKKAGGHDEHYGHKSDYGKKSGHKDHKKWKWSKKH